MIWPALSSADTSRWEWLHTCLKEERNTMLLWWEIMSFPDTEQNQKIAIFSDFSNSARHFLTCSFPRILVSVFATAWRHRKKDGEPYRNSEVAILGFTRAVITNSFSCSKNLCSFPVVSTTIAWMMCAAFVDSETGEANHSLKLWVALLPCPLPALESCTGISSQFCSFVLMCFLTQAPTFQTASTPCSSLECFMLVLACVFDKS